MGNRKMLRNTASPLTCWSSRIAREQTEYQAAGEEEDGEGHRVAQIGQETVNSEQPGVIAQADEGEIGVSAFHLLSKELPVKAMKPYTKMPMAITGGLQQNRD